MIDCVQLRSQNAIYGRRCRPMPMIARPELLVICALTAGNYNPVLLPRVRTGEGLSVAVRYLMYITCPVGALVARLRRRMLRAGE